jgi:threonine dehydrogenase-like Zn-dependent dehydrogenase
VAGSSASLKYIDELINLLEQRKIKLDEIIRHQLSLENAPHAHEIFF